MSILSESDSKEMTIYVERVDLLSSMDESVEEAVFPLPYNIHTIR
jgi:hypothetical protein